MPKTLALEEKNLANTSYLDCFRVTDFRRPEIAMGITAVAQLIDVVFVISYSTFFLPPLHRRINTWSRRRRTFLVPHQKGQQTPNIPHRRFHPRTKSPVSLPSHSSTSSASVLYIGLYSPKYLLRDSVVEQWVSTSRCRTCLGR